MSDREPDWTLYRSFLAVMQEGSLSGAARALGVAQPTIGRHLDALEETLGLALFVRSRLGLSPTEAAEALRPDAEALAASAAALLRTASGQGGGVRGAVRLTASEVIGVEVLPPILAALRAQWPELVIELVLSNTVQDLTRRDADVAVRMTAPTQGELVARKLGSIPLGLFAHRDYLARCGTPQTLEEGRTHTIIGFDRLTPALRAMIARNPGLDRAMFAFRADSDLAQLAAIRAGYGIGAMQLPLAARDDALVRVLADAFEIGLETWVVMHESLRATPRCRAVFDALVTGLQRYMRCAY